MKRLNLLCIFVLCFSCFAKSQIGGEFFVKIDTKDAAYHVRSFIPGVRFVNAQHYLTTIDQATGRHFFVGKTAFEEVNLYVVDIKTGKAKKYSEFPQFKNVRDNIIGLKFISDEKGFYSIHWDEEKRREYFVRIKGKEIFKIDSFPEVAWVSNITFSDKNNKYFYIGADSGFNTIKLYTVDLNTFKISSCLCSFGSNNSPWGLMYDDNTGKLYGTQALDDLYQRNFISLNENTCEVETLIELKSLYAVGFYTLDYKRSFYIFNGYKMTDSESQLVPQIYTIDIKNKAVINEKPFRPEFKDNIIEWKYAEKTDEVVALHWNHNLPTAPQEKFKILPNPNNGVFSILLDGEAGYKSENIRSIMLLDVLGRTVYHMQEPKFFEFNLSHFKAGVYMVTVETASGISTQKLVIQ